MSASARAKHPREPRFGPAVVIDFLFRHSLGKLPYFQRYAPGIELIGNSDKLIQRHLDEKAQVSPAARLSFLDIGARDATKSGFAASFDYHGLDINPLSDRVLQGDICACPHIADETFDVVFSLDVLEHVLEPWKAMEESLRITKPGGLIIHRTLFAYRYHPEPVDYWRFTSQCLEYLGTRSGKAETVVKGYDVRGRRRNRRGVFLEHRPPIDWLGGFRENWRVLWIGRKL